MTLPSLKTITARLRELHEAWAHPIAGPGTVCLAKVYDPDILGHRWEVATVGDSGGWEFGSEDIPGDGLPFDAVAAARRLLSEARSAGNR
jgi:hypothetical protein